MLAGGKYIFRYFYKDLIDSDIKDWSRKNKSLFCSGDSNGDLQTTGIKNSCRK